MKKPLILGSLLAIILALSVYAYQKFTKPAATVPVPQAVVPQPTPNAAPQVIGSIWEKDIKDKVDAAQPNKPVPAEVQEETLPLPKLASQEEPKPAPQASNSVSIGSLTPKSNTAEVETLQPMEMPEPPTAPSSQSVDPREVEKLLSTSKADKQWESLSDEEKLAQEHEPTNISVQRTFIAVLPDGKKEPIRVKVPVVYKSRYLRLTEANKKRTEELVAKSRNLEKKLEDAKKEAESILTEWNQIVRESIPQTALLPESPSLPENQSNSELNRPAKNPDLVPGQGANFEVGN